MVTTTAALVGQQQYWQGNRIILHTKQLRFKQQWQGNSGTLTYGMATTTAALAGQQRLHCEQQCYNNGTASAQQRLSTALPTATALVVKVKARTSNVYVQNVTR
jgi:hypothetical protein